MKISVMISSFNQPDLLRQTLLCLSLQTIDEEAFEVIISSAHYNEGCERIISSFQEKLKFIKYVYSNEITGISQLRNAALEEASNEICLFMDEGVIVPGDLLENVVKCHQAAARVLYVGRVHGMHQPANHQAMRILKPIYQSDHPERCFSHPLIAAYGDLRQLQYDRISNDLSRHSFPWIFANGSLFSVSLMKAVHEAGGFDERFHVREVEDLELAYRLWSAGYQFRLHSKLRGLCIPMETDNTDSNASIADRRVLEKHAGIAVELRAIPTVHSPHSLYTHFMQSQSYLRPDYSGTERLISNALQQSTLIVGCQSASLANQYMARELFILDSTCFDRTKLKETTVRITEKIGFITDKKAKEFDLVIVTDIWKVIPKVLMPIFLAEMFRIGKQIMVLDYRDLTVPHILLPTFRRIDEISEFCNMNLVNSNHKMDVYHIEKT